MKKLFAAASIIAKTARDLFMIELSKNKIKMGIKILDWNKEHLKKYEKIWNNGIIVKNL